MNNPEHGDEGEHMSRHHADPEHAYFRPSREDIEADERDRKRGENARPRVYRDGWEVSRSHGG